MILDEGNGTSLWFTGSFGSGGGTFTSPAGDFSTLVENSGGSYTRTLTDGSKQNFGSGGYETTSVDRNGLVTSYSYDGSHRLTQITDPFNETTSLTYSGGYLQSIEDPAGRFATFTHSGGALASVTYPDSNTWNYGYDSGGRMTKVTEPSSVGEPTKTTTIVYDSAERVSTIARPDSTSENFLADQEQGWTNSGTASNPAPSVLLSEASTVYTNALSNTTYYRPDWRGMGLTNQSTDALGNVATVDRDSNGLATITIDPMDRVTQDAYDSKGNVTKITYADLSTTTYGTYNSFAEPASMTDQLSRTTYYTYDFEWQPDRRARRAEQRDDLHVLINAEGNADQPDGPRAFRPEQLYPLVLLLRQLRSAHNHGRRPGRHHQDELQLGRAGHQRDRSQREPDDVFL